MVGCTGTTSVVVQIRGLEIMNDDPAQTDVMFARIVEDATLAKLQAVASMTLPFPPLLLLSHLPTPLPTSALMPYSASLPSSLPSSRPSSLPRSLPLLPRS